MGSFMGWASYDLKRWCPKCEEEYDPEYEHEHEDCGKEEEEEEVDIDK